MEFKRERELSRCAETERVREKREREDRKREQRKREKERTDGDVIDALPHAFHDDLNLLFLCTHREWGRAKRDRELTDGGREKTERRREKKEREKKNLRMLGGSPQCQSRPRSPPCRSRES